MKTIDQISDDLRELESAHYYSEDFHWLSAVRAYFDALSDEERALFQRVLFKRMMEEGSMTDILLCSVVTVPDVASVLAAKLDRESVPSQLTRALLTALQQYRGSDVFRAVARFVDSDQENEALRALARIDFARALPFTARAVRKAHAHGLVLHILHDRRKSVGLDGLILELRAFAAGWNEPNLLRDLDAAAHAKPADYNPFPPDELARLRAGLSA
ncbi:MAG TPA: hypothetical protein PKE12_09895 [Kiritimatiellia bacterium]|nr:hypothetical protein [Kiritimatiellia bacterium]